MRGRGRDESKGGEGEVSKMNSSVDLLVSKSSFFEEN